MRRRLEVIVCFDCVLNLYIFEMHIYLMYVFETGPVFFIFLVLQKTQVLSSHSPLSVFVLFLCLVKTHFLFPIVVSVDHLNSLNDQKDFFLANFPCLFVPKLAYAELLIRHSSCCLTWDVINV